MGKKKSGKKGKKVGVRPVNLLPRGAKKKRGLRGPISALDFGTTQLYFFTIYTTLQSIYNLRILQRNGDWIPHFPFWSLVQSRVVSRCGSDVRRRCRTVVPKSRGNVPLMETGPCGIQNVETCSFRHSLRMCDVTGTMLHSVLHSPTRGSTGTESDASRGVSRRKGKEKIGEEEEERCRRRSCPTAAGAGRAALDQVQVRLAYPSVIRGTRNRAQPSPDTCSSVIRSLVQACDVTLRSRQRCKLCLNGPDEWITIQFRYSRNAMDRSRRQ